MKKALNIIGKIDITISYIFALLVLGLIYVILTPILFLFTKEYTMGGWSALYGGFTETFGARTVHTLTHRYKLAFKEANRFVSNLLGVNQL